MCGIAGLFKGRPGNKAGLLAMTDNMVQKIRYRGPDDSGVWADSNSGIALAHCRLSIQDVSEHGHQPMWSNSGRYCITFNGEIYNFLKLSNELSSLGVHFKGHSDTEVLLAAIDAWGLDKAVQNCVGMFAFAAWDHKYKKLYLVRDRLGEKPLYYGWIDSTFAFASELKAITAHPDWRMVVNRDALTLYVRYGYIPAPFSIYINIYKLLPGTILEIDMAAANNIEATEFTPFSDKTSHCKVRPRCYWSLQEHVSYGLANQLPSNIEIISSLDERLRQAVKQQMISDVNIGAFLSGGIDSSTVVSIMQSLSSTPVKTFTIGFHENEFNEASFARKISSYLGTDHTELYVTADDALQVVPDLPKLYDEPFADSSQIPTYLVSKLARSEVKVCLSGDGGDELFGGYNRYYWTENLWAKLGWLPIEIRKIISQAILKVSPHQWDNLYRMVSPMLPESYKQKLIGHKIYKFSEVITSCDEIEMYHRLMSYWKNPESVVIGGAESNIYYSAAESLANNDNIINNLMYWDSAYYLPNDNLVKVDRASMAVSLETRLPLLDHRVFELAWKIPLSMKIKGGQGKWILRQVLYNYLPEALMDRPKTGFSVPIGEWLRGPLRGWAEAYLDEHILSRDGYFNPLLVRNKWKEHLSGRYDWSAELWTVLMFQAWYVENKK